MTGRRQEAIAMIAGYLSCPHIGRTEVDDAQAKVLYDRLAALREFPEEEVEALLEEADGETAPGYSGMNIEAFVKKFERLWHGQEAPMEPLIDHRPFKESKGGCPACGGSGKDPWGDPG